MNNNKEKILLHICCAPCSTYVIKFLSCEFDVIGYFYNPNIFPEKEYYFRVEEMKNYALKINLPLIVGEYDPDNWFKLIQGFENEIEGGNRCKICYKMRLESTVNLALKNKFQNFTTTLSISPKKKAFLINQVGEDLGNQYNLNFYKADFKKKDGFKISVQMSKELGMYRQNYCGCKFSFR